MIKKISKLQIANFPVTGEEKFNQEEEFQFGQKGNNCNIVLGLNGSGKTTLSNAISFFGDNLFISEDEKKEIFNDIKNADNSSVELNIQGKSTIKYPVGHGHNKNIYVFNSNFVSTHVFNGTKANLRKFSKTSGEIKTKEIDNINYQLNKLNEKKEKLGKENEEIDEKHKEINKNESKLFGEILTDKNKNIRTQKLDNIQIPSETIEKLETKRATLSADYELSKKQIELRVDLEKLQELNFNALILDFETIDELLSKNIQQLSKDVLEKKIKEVQNLFSEDQDKQGVEKWFRFGKDILENANEKGEKNCPICNTDISKWMNSILEDYKGYFDKDYEFFIKELKQKKDDIFENAITLNQLELSVNELEILHVKYVTLLNNLSFEKFNFKNVKADFAKLKESFEFKNGNIQNIFTKPKNIKINLIALNADLTSFQALKNNILEILESKKLTTHEIEEKIRQTSKEIIILKLDKTDKTGAVEKYKNNKKKIASITISQEVGLPFWKEKLREELIKLKIESKSISRYLKNMGIDHFSIDLNEEKQDENIIIKYKNLASEKNKLKNCLSDGEKTALAFAYFLSKFENEINLETEVEEATVVIDDPISSLDDNRLYSTAHLIFRNFEKVKQLIVLSHNFLFLKFFNSFHSGKARCLFLDQGKLCKLPDELKNFETPYFFMLQELINFQNKSIPYAQCYKYLPNYTRRVLETFLSFKFAKISSAKHRNYSAGLGDFNENIQQTSLGKDLQNELIYKTKKIKDISDKFSHGNLQCTQEKFYISEGDLKILVKNAIDVIEKMDNLHKTCFVENSKTNEVKSN